MTAAEKRREKARNLRYRKPIVRDLNLEAIQEQLSTIEESCSDVQWYCNSEDGWDTILNALDGDDDDAWEFKLAFSDLASQCERMRDDMDHIWLPERFDLFFAGIGAADVGGGLLGYDDYEEDYFDLTGTYETEIAEKEAAKQLERLTKYDLIQTAQVCFRVAVAFLALRSRYDDLKAALDILREQNTALLKQVKAIEDLYDAAEAKGFAEYDLLKSDSEKALDRLLIALPDRAWIE